MAFETPDDVTAVTWVDHDEAGRPVRFATAEYGYNKPRIAFEIASCEWEGDRCVRVRRRVNDYGERWREEVDEAEYDERGLVRVRGDFTWRREYDGVEDDPLAAGRGAGGLGRGGRRRGRPCRRARRAWTTRP